MAQSQKLKRQVNLVNRLSGGGKKQSGQYDKWESKNKALQSTIDLKILKMNNKLNENISKCVNLCEHHIQKYEEDKRSEIAEEKNFEHSSLS